MGAVGIDVEGHVEADEEIKLAAEAVIGPDDVPAVVGGDVVHLALGAPLADLRLDIGRDDVFGGAGFAGDAVDAVEIALRDRAVAEHAGDRGIGDQPARENGGADAEFALRLAGHRTGEMARDALGPVAEPHRRRGAEFRPGHADAQSQQVSVPDHAGGNLAIHLLIARHQRAGHGGLGEHCAPGAGGREIQALAHVAEPPAPADRRRGEQIGHGGALGQAMERDGELAAILAHEAGDDGGNRGEVVPLGAENLDHLAVRQFAGMLDGHRAAVPLRPNRPLFCADSSRRSNIRTPSLRLPCPIGSAYSNRSFQP